MIALTTCTSIRSNSAGTISCIQYTSAVGGSMKSTLPSPVRSRAFPLIPTERPATWVSVLPSPDVSTPAGVVSNCRGGA